MKRLGMWNRLAIVAAVLTLAIAPLWVISDQNRANFEAREAGLRLCRKLNAGTGKDDFEAWMERDQGCFDEFTRPLPKLGWDFYLDALMWTAVICAVTYILIWLTISTAKWVWRGRQASKP
jgi:hypothetical protein